MKLNTSHNISCSQDDFWSIYWNPAFTESLRIHAKIHTELIWEEDNDKQYERRVLVSPDRTLPAPLAKILGSSKLTYTQNSRWDKDSHRVHWAITPSVLSNKFEANGVFEVTKSTAVSCTMTITGNVRVKVPLVGSRIEAIIIEEVIQSYATIAKHINNTLRNTSS